MAVHLERGQDGERIAAEYLRSNGHKIVESNFRTRVGEIDLITRDGRSLVFIEVRRRKKDALVSPIETLDQRKISKVLRTAQLYLMKTGWTGDVRFDVVAVHGATSNSCEHYKNAFSADDA